MLRIITNNIPRDILNGWDLTTEERKEFDYLEGEDLDVAEFVRFKGSVYHLGDIPSTAPGPWNHGLPEEFKGWDGYASDSFFSGILIRYVEDNERVVMATYVS